MKKTGLFIATLVQGLLSGIAIGVVIGATETLVLLPNTTGTSHSLLIPAILFYSIVWSLAALVLGTVLFAASQLFGKSVTPGEGLSRWYFSFLVPLFIFIIVGGHINLRFLPAYTDPSSMLFNSIFLILNVALGYWFYFKGVGWIYGVIRRLPRWIKVVFIIAIAGGAAFSIYQAGLYFNARQKGTENRPEARSDSPNVLLITIDAVRPDHLSVYGGYERRTSPHLEQFAKEGVLFTNAFSNSSWTRASVATMFTSLYPSTHGVNGIATGLSPSLVTLSKVLKAHGYATGIFSANDFISPIFGYGEGVDRFHYKRVSMFNELILGHIFRTLRKYSSFIDQIYRPLENFESSLGGGGGKSISAAGLNEAFLNWIRTVKGRPFFAYFHYMETHTPYTAPPPFDKKFDPDYAAPLQKNPPFYEGFYPFSTGKPMPEEKFRNMVAQYDGAIAYVDEKLDELFRALKEMGRYENTVIIITADHGEEFYDHGGWGHGKSLFNEVVHVPLIVRYPRLFPKGKVVKDVVRHIDLMPTILDLSGIPLGDTIEGKSFVPLVQEQAVPNAPRSVYTETIHENSYARAVIEGGLKLIAVHVHAKETWFLFDREKDPKEKSPFDIEGHPKTPKLKELLSSFQEHAALKAVKPKTAEVDTETKERLKSLGYIQ